MPTIKTDSIKKVLKAHSKETGLKPFTTQIQYKDLSPKAYYEYTNTTVLIRFDSTVFNTKENIKLFPNSNCKIFPSTDQLFLNFSDDNKNKIFNTSNLLKDIRELEKAPKTTKKETKKHRIIDFRYNTQEFSNYHNTTLPDCIRLDSYHLKTVIRVFSLLQCDKIVVTYNEKQPHRPITLKSELATAIIAPIRYLK